MSKTTSEKYIFPPVRANTLFHFTTKKSILGILENGFFPKYHEEDLSNATLDKSIYKLSHIPMVCFCDLLLSQIKAHIDFYGDYGIGLRKKWGLDEGISPIVYIPKNSISSFHIKGIARVINKQLPNMNDRMAIRKKLQNFYKYVKAFEGFTKRKDNINKEHKVFYDESEWRYVPKGDNYPVISNKKISSAELKIKNEELAIKEVLKYKAIDVKYIIVKSESEIPFIVGEIERMKGKYDDKERKLLASKIISVEQIREDI